VLDSVSFNKEHNGYESIFHFEKLSHEHGDVITRTKHTLRNLLIPICANCKKIRDDNGKWLSIEDYFFNNHNTKFSHGICPECFEILYPWMDRESDGT
jgi:hypothetical protein